jgi:hypothetical protein
VNLRATLSKSRLHSDSLDEFKRNCVRIKVAFGQLWRIQERSCPNQRCIRTAWTNSRETVSESRLHSDSFGEYKSNRVRIKGAFGQLGRIQEKLCPNQGCIRTALGNTRAIVSESRLHSDSLVESKSNCVRIKVVFGQLWGN